MSFIVKGSYIERNTFLTIVTQLHLYRDNLSQVAYRVLQNNLGRKQSLTEDTKIYSYFYQKFALSLNFQTEAIEQLS